MGKKRWKERFKVEIEKKNGNVNRKLNDGCKKKITGKLYNMYRLQNGWHVNNGKKSYIIGRKDRNDRNDKIIFEDNH